METRFGLNCAVLHDEEYQSSFLYPTRMIYLEVKDAAEEGKEKTAACAWRSKQLEPNAQHSIMHAVVISSS
jgi:hypothetical protein